MITSFCPLCLSEAEILTIPSQQKTIFTCPDHGTFIISANDENRLKNLREFAAHSAECKAKLEAMSFREKLKAQQAHDHGHHQVREIQFDS